MNGDNRSAGIIEDGIHVLATTESLFYLNLRAAELYVLIFCSSK